MMKKSRTACLCCIALGLLSTATSIQAKRAGFTGLTALADSPESAFWNPAGITRVPESLELQLAIAYSKADFKVEEPPLCDSVPGPDSDNFERSLH